VHEYIASDIVCRRARAVHYQPRVSAAPRVQPHPYGGPADELALTNQRASPNSSQGRIAWVLCAQIGQTFNALPACSAVSEQSGSVMVVVDRSPCYHVV